MPRAAEREKPEEAPVDFILTPDEDGNPPPLSDTLVANHVHDTLNAERDARMPRERFWQENLRLLYNDHDWTGKEDWQAQVIVSKVPNAVNSAMAILKSALTATKDWFDLVGREPADETLAPHLKKLFRATIEERDPVNHWDTLDTWLIGLKHGMAVAKLVYKVVPKRKKRRVRVFEAKMPDPGDDPGRALAVETAVRASGGDFAQARQILRTMDEKLEVTTRLRSRTEVCVRPELVDPWLFYIDNTGEGKHLLQEIHGDKDELLNPEAFPASAGYNRDALARAAERCMGGTTETEEEQKYRANTVDVPQPGRQRYKGIEFWGDVPDPDTGEVVFRDHVATVINGVLVRLKRNPFDDGKPFVFADVEPLAFTQYGRSFIENVSGLARAIIELMNAVLDGVQYDVLKAFEIDHAVAQDPTEFHGGIKPGKVFSKDTSEFQTDRPLINAVDTGGLSTGAMAVLVQLDRDFQEGTNVMDLQHGLQPVRGSATATEIADRRQSSNVVFRSMAQWLEKTSLEPLLRMMFNRMIQFRLFGPGGDEWAQRVLGKEEFRQFKLKIEQRLAEGEGAFEVDVDFKVTALTSIVARGQELERIARLLEAIRGFPGLANRINMAELAKRIFKALGFASEDLMLPEERLAEVENLERQALAQAVAGVGDQPRSHSGPGTDALAATAPSGT